MKVEVKNKKVVIEIPFEEITHVYSEPAGINLDTGEIDIAFGVEMHKKPDIDLKIQIKGGADATYIMQELSKIESEVRLG